MGYYIWDYPFGIFTGTCVNLDKRKQVKKQMMKKVNLILILCMFFTVALGQIKTVWDFMDIVTPEGKTLERFKVVASTAFINDSILIVSCTNEKILGLISTPSQGLFDDTDYRIYQRIGVVSSITDSVGTVYRYTYEHITHNNGIVLMVDDSLSFVMIHPSPHVGLVFHNNKRKGRAK